MMYASLAELVAGQPVFDDTSYSDKTCIDKLRITARMISTILARYYTLPVSVSAIGVLTFIGNVSADDTVTVGAKTYKFVATPAAENDVDLGATSSLSAINLKRAINEGTNGGSYYTDTTINVDVVAARSGLVLTLTARKTGPDGNDLALSKSAANITVTTAFAGGVREYEVLSQINQWMATRILLAGQSNSAVSGGGNRSLVDDLNDYVKDTIADVSQHGGLTDTAETILTPLTGAMDTDCEDSWPWAGTDDPVYWLNDPDRVPDRE